MARVEIFSGRERRRFWSDAQKLAILDEIASSGLGVVAVARRHDVSPQQVYVWQRHFRRKALAKPTPSLVPVTLVEPEARSVEPVGVARVSRVEIRCLNGRVLIVETGFDAAELKALIRSVEDA
ncbi:transposase [Rhodoblastus sp.]|uniref:IS66-like element accessory protein TnpA n=1 Tax=Rhodoblastus sp. TaxID=1962975 RepID=UPI0035ADF90D